MTDHPPIVIANMKNEPERHMSLTEAIKNEEMRQVAVVIAYDEKGKVFLQKRAPQVKLFPNTLTHSASGHVDQNEPKEEAAKRELHEEIGVARKKLSHLVDVCVREVHERQNLYAWFCCYATQVAHSEVEYNSKEVVGGEWLSLQQINRRTATSPHDFAGGFLASWPVIEPYLRRHFRGEEERPY